MKANLNESSTFQFNRTEKTTEKRLLTSSNRATIVCTYKEQHKLAAQKTFFLYLGESTDENKALLFFLGLKVQFKLLPIPYNPLGYCFRFDLQCLKIL